MNRFVIALKGQAMVARVKPWEIVDEYIQKL
jgi:hypothetical protein